MNKGPHCKAVLVLSLMCLCAIADEYGDWSATVKVSPQNENDYGFWMREDSQSAINGFDFACSFPIKLNDQPFVAAKLIEFVEEPHDISDVRSTREYTLEANLRTVYCGNAFGECAFYCKSNSISRCYFVLCYTYPNNTTVTDDECDFYVFPLQTYVSERPFRKISHMYFSSSLDKTSPFDFTLPFSLKEFYNPRKSNEWSRMEVDVLSALRTGRTLMTKIDDVNQLDILENKLIRIFNIRAKSQNSIGISTTLFPSSFDFGERTEIERPVLTATLRNDGDRTIHVTDVIRTCVCANLELSATNLPPGGSAEVRCTLDPNVFSGPFLKTFFIKTDDPATPSITVPIRGSVRELWKVEPDKWHQMRAGDTNAVLRVKAAPDAPSLVRTEILGPAGASFEMRPAGEREFDAIFAPGDQPRGQHHWTVNLYPEGAETPALGLHLGAQIGEHWKCVPARLRASVNGRDFVADLLVKPADGKDLPADVDPAAITISPAWDHVSIEPLGPPTWRGIPLRLTVGAEMVSSWEFPKTFYLTIPNHGAASVYFEKIVLPSDADNR